MTTTESPLIVGIGLQNAIDDAANSYPTRPPIIYELDQSNTGGERTLLRLVDHLIEDTYHAASQSENFTEWKTQIAHNVQMYVAVILVLFYRFVLCCYFFKNHLPSNLTISVTHSEIESMTSK